VWRRKPRWRARDSMRSLCSVTGMPSGSGSVGPRYSALRPVPDRCRTDAAAHRRPELLECGQGRAEGRLTGRGVVVGLQRSFRLGRR
jgi:hypothetical protein